MAVRFENPKFDSLVPAKYDDVDNVIKVQTPQLLSNELLSQLNALDAELKATTEIEDVAQRKVVSERIDKDKKAILKSLPKYKVETSVTLNGVDFVAPKGTASFNYYETITAMTVTPEVGKVNDEIALNNEAFINTKTTLVRFVYGKVVVQVGGKFVKDKGVVCKVPLIEYVKVAEESDIQVKVFVSFNDGADWTDCDVHFRLLV